jgi:phosphate transport system substrate-binding protein
MILVARGPSEDEFKEAAEQKVKLDVRPVALDGFVFLLNVKNPVNTLTMDQIRDIYTGKVKNWKDVGGNDALIEAYTRNPNSGSQELMERLVMHGRKMIDAPHRMLPTMAAPIDSVSRNPNAIGYSVYYYEHVMNPHPENKLIAVQGVKPSSKTIAGHKYPLTTEVYVVTRKDEKADSPQARLRNWLLSDEGQQLVAESRYVPVKPKKKDE